MFAIFLTEAMDPFYRNVTSFPTLIFTVLLLLCIFYWLLAVLGVVDLDFLDIDVPDADADLGTGNDVSGAGVLGGLLLKLGLNGVPFPIVFTLVSLFGWFVSYYVVHFTFGYVPGSFLKFIAGIPVLMGSLYVAALITGLIIKPLRPIFKSANQQVEKVIVGQIAVIRTTRVDKNFGEAVVEDGGAGLIVKVRSYNDESFKRGDRVALLEYVPHENVYRVISEAEFNS